MVIKQEIIIDAPVEKAWKVLGHQFSQSFLWASAISHSEGKGHSFQEAGCSERGCTTSFGKIREKLTHFSHSSHSLEYELTEGMPFFIRKATNYWRLTEIGKDKTVLQIHAVMEASGIMGKLLLPFLKVQFSRLGRQTLEEFKYYVEHGTPHPRKVRAVNKSNG